MDRDQSISLMQLDVDVKQKHISYMTSSSSYSLNISNLSVNNDGGLDEHIVQQLNREGYSNPKLIGRGHFSETFRVVSRSSHELNASSSETRAFALKMSRPCKGAFSINRALKELTALAKLKNHPNIVRLENFFLVDDWNPELEQKIDGDGYVVDEAVNSGGGDRTGQFRLCIVMQLYKQSLEQRLRQQVKKTEQEPAAAAAVNEQRLWQQVLDLLTGLTIIHRAGFVHRDIKPDNVLEDEEGRLCLADLGLSRALSDEGLYFGTTAFRAYLAPEANDDEAPLNVSVQKMKNTLTFTTQTDMFSLGCVLVDLVCPDKLMADRNGDELPSASRQACDRIVQVVRDQPHVPRLYVDLVALLLRSHNRPSAEQCLELVPGGLVRLIELSDRTLSKLQKIPYSAIELGQQPLVDDTNWSMPNCVLVSYSGNAAMAVLRIGEPQRMNVVIHKLMAIPAHPLIATTFGYCLLPDMRFGLLSELIDGVSLKEWLQQHHQHQQQRQQQQPLTAQLQQQVVKQCASAVSHLHQFQQAHLGISATAFRVTHGPSSSTSSLSVVVRLVRLCLQSPVQNDFDDCFPTAWASPEFLSQRSFHNGSGSSSHNTSTNSRNSSSSGSGIGGGNFSSSSSSSMAGGGSVQSDIYMLGTLIYEVLTGGGQPYSGYVTHLPQKDAVSRIKRDCMASRTPEFESALISTTGGSQLLRDIMRQCWAFDPNKRPSLMSIVNKL